MGRCGEIWGDIVASISRASDSIRLPHTRPSSSTSGSRLAWKSASFSRLAAAAAARSWCATKFALLGYSFLPYQAYLTDARAAAAAPDVFRPLRGSLIFMMRPFYPPRLGRSVKKPS